ncbi:MAG TPA: endonuclease/exonuclease/phosphatase family protein [Opitutaceae bacterium]|jgi:endonuclease/exonuclease/phosphatase family metal-dependent hydrolase|nr:endonuclease/exonuclease/phosphatase family protein [Opitutaceae bacterium]
MRRAAVSFFLCTCLASTATRAETFTIATYNIENYTVTDRMTPEGYRQDYPKPEAEKTALRAVIHALHADVLVLEEMGPQPFLDELQSDLAQQGDDYPHAFVLDGPDPERHVAILSKRAWKTVTPHSDLEFLYRGSMEKVKRGLLEVTFTADDGDFTLWAVHLKSKLTESDDADDPQSANLRAAEAMAVRRTVLEKFPDPGTARFAILGDFNDGKGSKPLQDLLRRGRTDITYEIPAADSHGEIWTEFYAKQEIYSGIDHVLVSPGLRGAVRGGRAIIFDAPEVSLASDHRPVVVTLEFPTAE